MRIFLNMKKIHFIYLLAVLNAIILGLSFFFTKTALSVADPIDILMYRFSLSFMVVSIPVLFRWFTVQYRKKSLKRIAFISLLYPILSFSLQAYGLVYATSAEGGIVFALTPIVTALLASLFLKEQTTFLQKGLILLSVGGVMYIFLMKEVENTGFHLSSYIGFILLFLSVLSLAGYSVMSRSLSKESTPLSLSFMMMACGAVFFTVVSFVRHSLDHTLKELLVPLTNMQFLFSVVYLGILSSLVTSLLTNYTLSKIEASKLSVFSNLSTIVSIVAGAIFLNEAVFYYHWIGFVMIIVGIVGVNMVNKPKKESIEVYSNNLID